MYCVCTHLLSNIMNFYIYLFPHFPQVWIYNDTPLGCTSCFHINLKQPTEEASQSDTQTASTGSFHRKGTGCKAVARSLSLSFPSHIYISWWNTMALWWRISIECDYWSTVQKPPRSSDIRTCWDCVGAATISLADRQILIGKLLSINLRTYCCSFSNVIICCFSWSSIIVKLNSLEFWQNKTPPWSPGNCDR